MSGRKESTERFVVGVRLLGEEQKQKKRRNKVWHVANLCTQEHRHHICPASCLSLTCVSCTYRRRRTPLKWSFRMKASTRFTGRSSKLQTSRWLIAVCTILLYRNNYTMVVNSTTQRYKGNSARMLILLHPRLVWFQGFPWKQDTLARQRECYLLVRWSRLSLVHRGLSTMTEVLRCYSTPIWRSYQGSLPVWSKVT